MSDYTRGPWGVWNGTDVFTDYDGASEGAQIADCNVDLTVPDGHGLSVQEMKANARLIASAPEMLEAMRQLKGNAEIARYLVKDPDGVVSSALWETIQQAGAVIAKATGESQ